MAESVVRSAIEKDYQRFQNEFYELLRIRSISPVTGFEKEVLACAQKMAGFMNAAGIHARVYETEGNPIVYGETDQKPGRPTILIYGHYDVQPEGDLSQWDSDPYIMVPRK